MLSSRNTADLITVLLLYVYSCDNDIVNGAVQRLRPHSDLVFWG